MDATATFAACILIGTSLVPGPAFAQSSGVGAADGDGADDEQEQSDLTAIERDCSVNGTSSLPISVQLDPVSNPGGNTSDISVLFDTDGDGFANYSYVITLGGDPFDVTGIALTLSKLEKDVAQLPLKNEIPQAETEPAVEPETEAAGIQDFASKIWGDIKGLVTVRRSFDSGSPALLPPGQKFFLEQNLRLKLQTARLALLNRDSQVFQDSIKTSTAWLDEYFDGSAAATANLKSSLAPYSSLELNPALPDISKTLGLLEEWQTQQDSEEGNS